MVDGRRRLGRRVPLRGCCSRGDFRLFPCTRIHPYPHGDAARTWLQRVRFRTRPFTRSFVMTQAAAAPLQRPLRILFLVNWLGRGGAERQLATLAVGLAERGHDVAIGVFRRGGEY